MTNRLASTRSLLEAHPIISTAAAAAILRLSAVAVLALRRGTTFPDEQQYVDLAGAAARGELNEQFWRGYGLELHRTAGAFTRPLSVIYKVTGESRLVGQLFAACFGIALCALIAHVVARSTDKRTGLYAGLLSALWPSQVVFSSTVLRESEVWLLLCAIGLCLLLRRGEDWRTTYAPFAGVLVGLLALNYLRPQTAVIAGIAVVLAAAVRSALSRRLLPLIVLTAIAFVVPAISGYGYFGEKLIRTKGAGLDVDRVELAIGAQSKLVKLPSARNAPAQTGTKTTSKDPKTTSKDPKTTSKDPKTTSKDPKTTSKDPKQQDSASGPPRCIENVVSHGPDVGKPCAIGTGGEAIVVEKESRARTTIRGLLAMLVLPLPWSSDGSISSRMAQFENLGWFVLYGAAGFGVWTQRRRFAEIAFPLFLIGGIVGAGALSQGNVGTAFRHRGQIFWALIILAAPAIQRLGYRIAASRAADQDA